MRSDIALGSSLPDQPMNSLGLMSNVREIKLREHGDERGLLVSIEGCVDLQFPIRRVYYIYATAADVVRGKHAHRSLRQLLISIGGACTIDIEMLDGTKASHHLNDPTVGLIIEGCVWREMRDFSPDAILLVLADSSYDETDYIRDYQIFSQIKLQSVQ